MILAYRFLNPFSIGDIEALSNRVLARWSNVTAWTRGEIVTFVIRTGFCFLSDFEPTEQIL
jgi:hypothetical protein